MKMVAEELIREIEAQRSLMISVATGEKQIQDANDEYKERRTVIRAALSELGISDPVPYSDLWAWHSRWSDGTLPKYRDRRAFISNLVDPLMDRLRESHPTNSPPPEPQPPQKEDVLPHSIVSGTRGYIERIVYQINGTYEQGWFDSCAVMIRRLVETLIIEAFEHHNIASKIQSPSGDYLYLKDLISRALSESTWHLGRNTRNALPRLKDIGDQSAHSRRYIAQRGDIEKIASDLRTVVQELVFLAGLK